MEGLEDFKKRIRKVNCPRQYKVNNSLGVYDGYKWLRKNKWFGMRPLKEHEYYSIIRKINLLLSDEISNGNDIALPYHMGHIELRKGDVYIGIDNDGKLKTNLPIDWNKTLELWYEDEESYKNKTLIKMEEQEIFKIYYNKWSANYNNKSYYEFIFNKDLKVRLKQKIKEGVLDAPLLKRKERLNG